MFVAPLSIPRATGKRMQAIVEPVAPSALRFLMCWLVGGVCALALVPDLRGGALSGATLPFWLVAAPAIDIAWLARRRIVMLCRKRLNACAGRVPQAKRFQSRRRADRSSRK